MLDKHEANEAIAAGGPVDKGRTRGGQGADKSRLRGGQGADRGRSRGGQGAVKGRSRVVQGADKSRLRGGQGAIKGRSSGGQGAVKGRSRGGQKSVKGRSRGGQGAGKSRLRGEKGAEKGRSRVGQGFCLRAPTKIWSPLMWRVKSVQHPPRTIFVIFHNTTCSFAAISINTIVTFHLDHHCSVWHSYLSHTMRLIIYYSSMMCSTVPPKPFNESLQMLFSSINFWFLFLLFFFVSLFLMWLFRFSWTRMTQIQRFLFSLKTHCKV